MLECMGTTPGRDEITELAIELEQRARLGAPDYTRLLRQVVRAETDDAAKIFEIIAPRLASAGFEPAGDGATAAFRPGAGGGGVILLVPAFPAGASASSLVSPFSLSHGIASGPRIGTCAAGAVAAVAAIEALEGAGIETQPVTIIASPSEGGGGNAALNRGSWAIEIAPPEFAGESGGPTGALLELVTLLADELDVEPPVAAPMAGSVAAAIAGSGRPVVAAAGPPLAERDDAREAVDMEAFVRSAAFVAALIAAYRPD